MKKIIMFIGGNETQEYFSIQLEEAFKKLGHEVYLFQLEDEDKSMRELADFMELGNTVMVSFNYNGLDDEECFHKDGLDFWEEYEIPCYNIALDHPFYYHKFLEKASDQYIHISIDHGHERYVKRFFPKVKHGPFLPLAGTELPHKPLKERNYDIVFTGNYTPPSHFEKFITRLDDSYTDFYYDIIYDLIDHTELGMDDAFVKHLKSEIPEISDQEMKLCMEKMIFIDLYVRFHFRGLAVKTLVDSGHKVYTVGAGWDVLDCKHPENIIQTGNQNSRVCLEAIGEGKISLNVMPWFKEGAHDRVFNSQLNGAVCVSDESIWLKEHLVDGKEIVFYQLQNTNQLPEIVGGLLADPSRMEEIAQLGYQKAKQYDTWANRAEVLSKTIEENGY